MKPGTIVEVDGKEATVVYNGLDGIGVIWGRHVLSQEDKALILQGVGNLEAIDANGPPPESWSNARDRGLLPQAIVKHAVKLEEAS